jgi:hypothetical protein
MPALSKSRQVATLADTIVSVKDFGAVGDGVTDDTAALIAAVTTGALVYLPDGTYILSNSVFPSIIRLRGAGVGKSIIKWKSASAESNLVQLSGVVDVQIENVTFDANQQNQTDSAGFYGTLGGTISNASIIVLTRCEFKNGRIADIALTGPTATNEFAVVELNRCSFVDGLVGTATRAAQAVSLSEGIRLSVTGCMFRQPIGPSSYGRGGVVMQRPAGSTATSWGQFYAAGNTFENFGRQTSDRLGCLYVYSGSELTTISSNLFENSYGVAVCVKADCGQTSIVGNVVNNHTDAVSAALSFFDQADSYTSSLGRNLIISNNAVYAPQLTSIFVDGARSGFNDLKNIIISDNICDGGSRGIHARNIDTMKIRGNIVQNTTTISIFFEDAAGDIEVASNTLTSGVVGLDVNGSTSGARFFINNNQVSTLTGTAFRIRSSVESFYIANNSVSGCTEAFDTRGATASSAIRENTVRGETGVWSRTGTYNGLQFENNITSVAMAFSTRTVTIATGAITVLADWHWVDTEGAAATDDLDTINGGYEGRRIVLYAANNARDVVVKDGTGNLRLAGDFTLTHADDSIELIFRSSVWVEIGRSDNTA